MILLRQMIILFILMLAGYGCRKYKVLSEGAFKPLALLVTQIANPALIISASLKSTIDISSVRLLKVVGFTFVIYLLLLVISRLAVHILPMKYQRKNMYLMMLLFSNIGFMGLPLVQVTYGQQELFYMTIFQMPYDLLIYTYGVYLLNSEEKIKNKVHEATLCGRMKVLWRNLMNPGSAAALAAMLIYVTACRLPDVITQPLTMLGNLAAPLSMMVIGASFCDMKLRELVCDIRLLLFGVVKLLVLPFFLIVLLWLCKMPEEMLHVCLIIFATPVGSMVAMFARQYETQQELAEKAVVFTTVCSVITIPLLQIILEHILSH